MNRTESTIHEGPNREYCSWIRTEVLTDEPNREYCSTEPNHAKKEGPNRTSHRRENPNRKYCSLLFTTVPSVLASLRTEPLTFASDSSSDRAFGRTPPSLLLLARAFASETSHPRPNPSAAWPDFGLGTEPRPRSEETCWKLHFSPVFAYFCVLNPFLIILTWDFHPKLYF